MEDRTSRVVDLPSGRDPASGAEFPAGLSLRDHLAAWSSGALAAAVYVLTAAPTVAAGDSGELAAAAATLGIPHPPGYPLYVLLGKLFLTLVPFGEVAWRLNLLSGLLSGTAVALSVLLARRLSASRAAAASAGLTAAFSAILWSQSTAAEVYTLAAVVFLALLHATLLYLREPRLERLWALAYLAGLSLTAHPSLVLALGGVGAAVLLREPLRRGRARELLSAVPFALLGFSLYLYLPLRSLADPAMDWGDPETLEGFLAHLLRRQYAGLRTPPRRALLDPALYLGHLALFEVGPVVLLFSALGVSRLWRFPGEGFWPRERLRARRAFRAAWVLWALGLSAGFLPVLTVSFERSTLALNRVFFIPLLLLMVPAVAVGLDRARGWLAAGRAPRLGAASGRVLQAALPLGLLLWSFPAQDKSGYTIARDYAEAVLGTLPRDAVYIPSSDHASFPVLYLQVVEGRRRDVVVADRYGYLDPSYMRRLCTSEEEARRVRRMARGEAERWLIDRAGRAVLTSSKRAILEIPPERFVPTGILYRVDRERSPLGPQEAARLWASYRFRNLSGDRRWRGRGRDEGAEVIMADILFLEAERHFAAGERELARRALRGLAEVGRRAKEILQNAGSLLSEKGFPREAAAFYERALALDPGYAQCRRNYAWTLLRAGVERPKAIALSERSLEELAAGAAFLSALAGAYRAERRYENAVESYLAAAGTDPADWESPRLAGEILEKELRRPEAARAEFEESLRRKPTQPELIEKVYGKEARRRYERLAERVLEGMAPQGLPGVPGAGRLSVASGHGERETRPGELTEREDRHERD